MTRIAFVCVGNAGRSQLATALAERERDRRGLTDVEIVTGGIDPHDHVHEDVVAVLQEEGIDIGDRRPRNIRPEDVADAEYVITMGCSAADFVPADWDGTAETWDLEHPGSSEHSTTAEALSATREQREEVSRRVADLFDRITDSRE